MCKKLEEAVPSNVMAWRLSIESLSDSCDQRERFWVNDCDAIMCETEEDANCIADFFEQMGLDIVTGYYDPDEDMRTDQVDDCTGFWYVDIS